MTITNRASEDHSPSGTTILSVHEAALAWIRANLPTDARLLTDGLDPPPGYTTASLSTSAMNWRDFDYLLTTDTNVAPRSDDAHAAVWRSSTPVALFEGMQVRRILGALTPGKIIQTRDADRADRLLAGTALLSNPSIVATPGAKSTLARGELDMRAAAALSALAGSLVVHLSDIKVVEPEAAAGIPARSITIKTSDTAKALNVLSGLSAAFRPDEIGTGEDGVVRLRWPLSFTPLPAVK